MLSRDLRKINIMNALTKISLYYKIPERDEIILHEWENLLAELFVPGEHLQGFVDEAVDVGQMLNRNVAFTLGLVITKNTVHKKVVIVHSMYLHFTCSKLVSRMCLKCWMVWCLSLWRARKSFYKRSSNVGFQKVFWYF